MVLEFIYQLSFNYGEDDLYFEHIYHFIKLSDLWQCLSVFNFSKVSSVTIKKIDLFQKDLSV